MRARGIRRASRSTRFRPRIAGRETSDERRSRAAGMRTVIGGPGLPLLRRSTLWNESQRRGLLARLHRLSPTATARWGRLDAPRMLAHLGDAARLALGEIAAPARTGGAARILRHAPAKQLLVYVLPFPRRVPKVHALFTTAPAEWAQDVDALARLFERLAARAAEPRPPWPEHPFFGRLSTRAWGVLGYAHTDHHLRQFGV